MIEKILDGLTEDNLDDISYELARRMRRHKPINPLDPLPQCEPIDLSAEMLKVVDQVQGEIEVKYQTKIDQISDEAEAKILGLLFETRMELFRASPNYDPERGKRLIEELRNTVPHHNIRYGKIEVIDGKLVQVG